MAYERRFRKWRANDGIHFAGAADLGVSTWAGALVRSLTDDIEQTAEWVLAVVVRLYPIPSFIRRDVRHRTLLLLSDQSVQRKDRVLFVYSVFPDQTAISAGKLCRANTLASAIVLECTIVAVELVLLVRGSSPQPCPYLLWTSLTRAAVHALYNRSRVVLVALLTGFAASFCATFFGMYSAADHLQFDEQCLISSAPRIMILVW